VHRMVGDKTIVKCVFGRQCYQYYKILIWQQTCKSKPKKYPSTLQFFIFGINVRKYILKKFKYHYETIMHFIKFILNCTPSFNDFSVRKICNKLNSN